MEEKKIQVWSESLRHCFCIKQGLFNVRDIGGLVSMDARFPQSLFLSTARKCSLSYSPFIRRHGHEPLQVEEDVSVFCLSPTAFCTGFYIGSKHYFYFENIYQITGLKICSQIIIIIIVIIQSFRNVTGLYCCDTHSAKPW